MGTKLYPPLIKGTLPAFWLNYDTSKTIVTGASITIPFEQNQALGATVQGLVLRLRTASTSSYLFSPVFTKNFNLETQTVSFYLSSEEAQQLNEGQYYKAQIAYCGKMTDDKYGILTGSDIGYFSTVGIIKCTSKPKVYIDNLTQDSTNFFTNEFIGTYDQSECKDQTEKVYSYEFVIYDENDEVFYTTGEKLHQSSYDTEYDFSFDRVLVNDFIKEGATYSIQYKVTTENELKLSTPKYGLTNENLASPNDTIQVLPESNVENGYVTIHFKGEVDKDKSYYYILNEAFLESEKVNGEYITDGINKTALGTIRSHLVGVQEKVEYLKTHTLFKSYSDTYADGSFHYIMTDNIPYEKVMYEYSEGVFRYINVNSYNEINNNSELTDEEKIEAFNALPYYEVVAVGRNLVKNFSYRYVEENFGVLRKDTLWTFLVLDDKNFYFIEKIPYEAQYYGRFILSRSTDKDNYQTWETIAQFRFEQQAPSSYSFRDMTVEHGRKYRYGLQQTNIWGLVSSRILSDIFEVSFEDMFLYDGKKLLKIRFNPLVESFKTKILEQKTDTIGGKFPYITRNGATYYKEFPIGGLIACEMDEDQMFHTRIQGVAHRHSTNVKKDRYDENGNLIEKGDIPENGFRDWRMFSDENILLEREFKLAVLDWLNDGQPKLFKSPYEGNYIVRLMNNELKPIQELGRMLHNFTSQAYEIADCTYNNLVSYGFVNVYPPSDYVGLWRTYILADPSLKNADGDIEISFDAGLETFTVQDMMPGDVLHLTYSEYGEEVEEEIMIGITGSYTYSVGKDRTILNIKIYPYSQIYQTSNRNVSGILQCYYQGVRITAFDSIIKQRLKTVPSQQYIGVNPGLEQIRRYPWGVTDNDGVQSFNLQESQRFDLQGYNVRDYIDDCITDINSTTGNITYKTNAMFKKYMFTFNPAELLDRITATIYKGQIYKIQLLNIEKAKFRLRDIIPVYIVDANMHPNKYTSGKFEGQDFGTGNVYVSTSPYGYPHRIEELTKFEMIDPYCIFQVFEMNSISHTWVPVSYGPESISYYDPYYRTWLKYGYDPSFKVNYTWKKIGWRASGTAAREFDERYNAALYAKDRGEPYNEDDVYDYLIQYEGTAISNYKYYYINKFGEKTYLDDNYEIYDKEADEYFAMGLRNPFNFDISKVFFIKDYETNISLATIKEKDYTELKDVNSICIGTGVIAELTFQIKVIDYYTEVHNPQVAEAKQKYLELKQFYDSLMTHYATIARADYYRKKYVSLRNAYQKLLNGTNGFFLSDNDRTIIRQLLANNYEVEQLKVLTLYNETSINMDLDQSAIVAMYDYKKAHPIKTNIDYGMANVKLLQYKVGGTILYFAIDKNEIQYPTVSGSSMANEDKTIYRQINTDGSVVYYALDKNRIQEIYSSVHTNILPIFDQLCFTYDPETAYNATTIDDLVVNRITLQEANMDVYELSEVEQEPVITKLSLLDIYDVEELKLSDRFIKLEEVPYTEGETTFYELLELSKLSNADKEQDTDIEGVANKVKDLTSEVNSFNEKINNLINLYETEYANYLTYYNNLKSQLESYNSSVYKSWAYQELVYLLNANESWAAIRTQFSDEQNIITDELEELQNKVKNLLTATQNLYYLIVDYQPKITLYQQMIHDGTNDELLDNYLEDAIIFAIGDSIKCLIAMFYALKQVKELITTHSDQKEIYEDLFINCIDKYNEVYPLFVNPSTLNVYYDYANNLRKYLNSLLEHAGTPLSELRSLQLIDGEYVDPQKLAEGLNAFEDFQFMQNWTTYVNQSFSYTSSTEDEYRINKFTSDILSSIFDINPTTINNVRTMANQEISRQRQYFTTSNEESYNIAKKRGTFYYRTYIRRASGQADPRKYKKFIFYPLSTESNRKDPELPAGYNTNKSYFDHLTDKEQQQVLEVTKKLNENVLYFLDEERKAYMNDTSTLATHITNNYLLGGKSYCPEDLNEERRNIMNPPYVDGSTTVRQPNAYTEFNRKILAAETYVRSKVANSGVELQQLLLTPGTRTFFLMPNDDNGVARSIMYTNMETLSEVYTDTTTGEQTILPGYYKTYLETLAGKELDDLRALLEQATRLLNLYEQQNANYLSKYNKYNKEYGEQEAIFSAYRGTDEMDFYLYQTTTLEEYRQQVKKAWWTFLSLLDKEYTKERERGMYKS